jgi:hypothetical protein
LPTGPEGSFLAMPPILNKLQKLMNHEKSARQLGNIAEAEAFAAKAQHILLTHKLSLEQTGEEHFSDDDPITHRIVAAEEAELRPRKSREEWTERLADAIARNFLCRLLLLRNSNTVVFVGRRTEREAAAATYLYLVNASLKFCEKEFRSWKKTVGHGCRTNGRACCAADSRRWKRSFLVGFAIGLDDRLSRARHAAYSQSAAFGGNLVSLRSLDEALDRHVQNISAGRPIGGDDHHCGAYSRGRAHADSVALSGRKALEENAA